MATYTDLATIHVPSPRSKPPATWGLQVRENFEFFYTNRRFICTSSTRPTGVEGLEIYETDTDRVLVYDGTNWKNTAEIGATSTWTPTLAQSGSVTKTTNIANYSHIGRRTRGEAHVTATGAGGGATGITLTTPDTMVYSGSPSVAVGSGGTFDASAAVFYQGFVTPISSTTIAIWAHNAANVIAVAPSFTLANTDQVTMQFDYYSTT